jgi:poly-beta-1,6-N-acetyl-D-glucosamine synthase
VVEPAPRDTTALVWYAPADESQAASGVDTSPRRPADTVDIEAFPPPLRRVSVPAGGDLQQALDQARPGDQIELASGATYLGPFRLPRKEGNGWIVITSVVSRGLAPGERVTPAHASSMPKLRAASAPIIAAEPGAHHYRFVGVEVAPTAGTWLNALVQLGDDERSLSQLPHDIIFDRCYLHGDPVKGSRRGIALNSRRSAVVNSYLADFKEVGGESQAIAGWNGPGPFTIENNYLEAAGVNVLFGGADPSIQNLVPADILVRGNHFAKPLRWWTGHPDYEGTHWSVKNLFELKNARRVVVEGNLLEHNWTDAQNGFAILLTVRNQEGRSPWSVVEDVTFARNVVRHAGGGINILGHDDIHKSQQTRRIAIEGNLFTDIGGQWGSGRLFQLLDGTRDIRISHNTAFQTGAAVLADRAAHTGFVFENNLVLHNESGIVGSGAGSGKPSIDRYFPGSVVRRNVLVGANPALYPTDNFFPASLDSAGLVKGGDGWYRVARAGRYAGAGSDGRDIGADVDLLTQTMDRVASAPVASDRASRQGIVAAPFGGAGAATTDGVTARVVFWLSLLLLAYTYAGYPLIAWLRARLLPRPIVRAPLEPTVSVILVAHNEEACIEARIENLLALDYPSGHMQILVGSDGSTDETANRAKRYAHHGVQVVAFRRWRGKAAVVNDMVRRARGEIVVFADARQRFDPQVVRRLAARFADPKVGAVSGELMLTDGNGVVGRGASFYWRYEKFIRVQEGRAGSTVGATGAIYAIRRALYRPIPSDTILDDVLIPMRIVQQGYSVQFEQEARAFQAVSRTAHQEYARKVRTIAGAFQLFAREWWLFNPLRNKLWFETMSHKGLRLLLPVFHATLVASSLALADVPLYGAVLAAQVGFYAAALAGHALRHAERRPMIASVPYAMCLMLWSTLAAFGRFLTDRQQVTWEQTPAFELPRTSTAPR